MGIGDDIRKIAVEGKQKAVPGLCRGDHLRIRCANRPHLTKSARSRAQPSAAPTTSAVRSGNSSRICSTVLSRPDIPGPGQWGCAPRGCRTCPAAPSAMKKPGHLNGSGPFAVMTRSMAARPPDPAYFLITSMIAWVLMTIWFSSNRWKLCTSSSWLRRSMSSTLSEPAVSPIAGVAAVISSRLAA